MMLLQRFSGLNDNFCDKFRQTTQKARERAPVFNSLQA